MIKVGTTFCPYCETQRSDSNMDGRCRFCNTELVNKEVELPDLDSSTIEKAKQWKEDHKPVCCQGNGSSER
ncbi:hypothetical protein [Paenibacillus sp. FSL L8-0333]|uniref:hypothetical protein n=1 Tax=Paenibacillus sp. FSL L8-0333 TaxID=2975331 RepID=UPI0030CF362A